MDNVGGLQSVLNQVYPSMVKESGELIAVAQGVAAFAAIWYIGIRVWKHIGKAEPIDVAPLLRPFAIGCAIALYPYLVSLLDDVMSPVTDGTAKMQANATAAIADYLNEKDQILSSSREYQLYPGGAGGGDQAVWEKYAQDSGFLSGISNPLRVFMAKTYYSFREQVRSWLANVLECVYEAAALCINVLRTFNLVVLGILGPLVLAFSVFDGFHHIVHAWLARYITVYLWLPVANIFGAIIATIQVYMQQQDISQLKAGDPGMGSNAGYLIFLIMGIIGYWTVPTVAGFIVNTAGGSEMTAKMKQIAQRVGQFVRKNARDN